MGASQWLSMKMSSAEGIGLIPDWKRYTGEGNGNLSQYYCLEHPTDRGAWWATVLRVAKESDTI